VSETLGAFFDEVVSRAPDREAVSFAPAAVVTERWTWRRLAAEAETASRRLVGLGVGHGTRLGLLCPNRPEWLAIAFGALRLGAVLVPFSTLWTREEIRYGLVHADVEILLTRSRFLRHDYVAHLRAIAPEIWDGTAPAATPALRRVVVLGEEDRGLPRWDALPADVADARVRPLAAAVRPNDVATIFFTSGTTAQAKAVVHAHGALTLSGRRIGACLGIGPDDAWWGHMPLFWSGGFIIGALATMAGGGRLVLHELPRPADALRLLEAERCTILAGWHQAGPLMEQPGFDRTRLALRKGSNHPLATALMGEDHLACGMYGMSETATCVACARWDDPVEIRRETFGRPLAGMTVRIVDPDTGREQPVGETGEIRVKGPTLMLGYLRIPPSETFTPEGFFRTGDLGYLDEDGYLHFGSRLKDVIKTAGVNVAAVEVEEAIARMDGVKAVHVVGVPDAVRGENVAAFVVPMPGATVDPDAVTAFCKGTLASYKVPRHVFVVDDAAIPRTGTGKIAKPALREKATALLQE
jgi:fatty-acyl-CoA synthase